MIIMASDHRGYLLKEDLKAFFNQENIITIDVGTYSKEPVDYPDFAKLGIEKVLENDNNVGIFICGSGIGMSIAANRNPKIRAGLCLNEDMAYLARKDNDANVLCLSGALRKKKAIKIVKMFLTTSFEGGRHARRLKKISGDVKEVKTEKPKTSEKVTEINEKIALVSDKMEEAKTQEAQTQQKAQSKTKQTKKKSTAKKTEENK